MSDIRGVTIFGKPKDVLVDLQGRVLTLAGGTPKIYAATGAAALSLLTTMGADFGRPFKVRRIAVTFSSAPTTSENLTLTQNVYADGKRPLPTLFSVDPSLTSATSVVKTWNDEQVFQTGDEVTLAYTNTDTRTYKAEIVVEVL